MTIYNVQLTKNVLAISGTILPRVAAPDDTTDEKQAEGYQQRTQ